MNRLMLTFGITLALVAGGAPIPPTAAPQHLPGGGDGDPTGNVKVKRFKVDAVAKKVLVEGQAKFTLSQAYSNPAGIQAEVWLKCRVETPADETETQHPTHPSGYVQIKPGNEIKVGNDWESQPNGVFVPSETTVLKTSYLSYVSPTVVHGEVQAKYTEWGTSATLTLDAKPIDKNL